VNGILVLNKDKGVTSHRVVQEIRKILPGIKAGHSGTLDPMATGVLPVCLGKATRVVEYIIELPKVYRAAVVLGKTSDTEDSAGIITEKAFVPGLSRFEVEKILERFTGTIEQLPPRYSAVKYKGKPLYKWTRDGEEVPRRQRSATIYSIELLEYNPDCEPQLLFDVCSSRGTYIRTLAADIGKAIGSGAYLYSLIRLSVGPYNIENSFTVAEIAEAIRQGRAEQVVCPIDSALLELPKLSLNDSQIETLKFGQVLIPEDQRIIEGYREGQTIRIYDSEGKFKALARPETTENGAGLRTVKYLA
jgi:tRNA pseudouridine55 synthase